MRSITTFCTKLIIILVVPVQDLVRCVVEDDEMSAVDRKVTERMEARAKRFNLETSAKYDDLVQLYNRYVAA